VQFSNYQEVASLILKLVGKNCKSYKTMRMKSIMLQRLDQSYKLNSSTAAMRSLAGGDHCSL